VRLLHHFLFGYICFFIFPLYSSVSEEMTSKLNNLKKVAAYKIVRIECKEGYVLTAKHVIDNCAEEGCLIIWIDNHNIQHSLEATIVCKHPFCDVAKQIAQSGMKFYVENSLRKPVFKCQKRDTDIMLANNFSYVHPNRFPIQKHTRSSRISRAGLNTRIDF